MAKPAAGLTKAGIRSKILLRLKTQEEEERNEKSRRIKDKLFRSLVFKKAKIIMFYIAFEGEVNTQQMIKEAQNLGKIITVPVCRRHCTWMSAHLLGTRMPLVRGPYGVSEPAEKKPVSLKKLDLVVVPGIAFDSKNNRLGRGKGFYDRFLKRLPKKTATFGLAFDFQILPSIPITKTDIPLSKVIFA